MKLMKLGIRIWITITAVLGFLGGWAMLAHANKPAPLDNQPTASDPALLPTLEPIPSLGQNRSSTQLQPLPSLPLIRQGFPRLRTGGS